MAAVRLGLPGLQLGADHVDLLLELGHADDRLGGALLGLLEADGVVAALAARRVGPAGLGVELAGRLGGRFGRP